MSETLKHRLVGALVLFIGAIVLLPFILGEPRPPGDRAPGDALVPATPTLTRTDVQGEALKSAPDPVSQSVIPAVVTSESRKSTPSSAHKQQPKNPRATSKPLDERTIAERKQVSLAGKWNVQLGSFSSASNARGLQRKLRGKGFDAFIISSSDQKLHRVLVGPYSDRNRADAAIPKLRKLTGLDGVTRRVQG